LGRIHSADEARRALETVKRAQFENFSLDLIYANPGQTLADLETDLEIALEIQPPHLSAYNLTFEEGTPFHREHRAGKMTSLGEDEEIAMAELIERKLKRAGLQRYEISNYARPDCHSRHNVNYWRGGDYLGLGAGAHSYLRNADGVTGRRQSDRRIFFSRIASHRRHWDECLLQEIRQISLGDLPAHQRLDRGRSARGQAGPSQADEKRLAGRQLDFRRVHVTEDFMASISTSDLARLRIDHIGSLVRP